MKHRRALVVGIDYYKKLGKLKGCVNDANSVAKVLKEDEHPSTKNFHCKVMTSSDKSDAISMMELREEVENLFSYDGEAALFYFAGHGHSDTGGGYLLASDSGTLNQGLSLVEVMAFANKCNATNKIIILDSCHAGAAGADLLRPDISGITEGTTILTAAAANKYAIEKDDSGVFTKLFVDALRGGASDLIGRITPGAVYAHIDQSLGSWETRPVFKTNIREFFALRTVEPRIQQETLRKIVEFFPRPDSHFELNPTFEPQEKGRDEGMPAPIEENTKVFAILQKFNRNGLVVPVGVEHMWDAAMKSKTCRLTHLGTHYHRLVTDELI